MSVFMNNSHQTVRAGTLSTGAALHTVTQAAWLGIFAPLPLLSPVSPGCPVWRLLPATSPRLSARSGLSLDSLDTGSADHRVVESHQGAPVTHQGAVVPHLRELHLEACDEGLNAEAGVHTPLARGSEPRPRDLVTSLSHHNPPAAAVRFLPDSAARH